MALLFAICNGSIALMCTQPALRLDATRRSTLRWLMFQSSEGKGSIGIWDKLSSVLFSFFPCSEPLVTVYHVDVIILDSIASTS